ncbi:hypothetical protein [Cytobacillus horneckiae]|uniref:hypothetical protein n=1 Tax=Cytobacillus horneckiae TaxID=549687 RepID=UPI003D9A724B
MAAKPIRTAPKVQSKAKVEVAATTVKPKKTIKTSVAPKPKRNTVVLRVEKTKVIKVSKGSPKGGSSTAGKSPSSAKKSSSSNKQIMEDSADDAVGDKVTESIAFSGGKAGEKYLADLVGGESKFILKQVVEEDILTN